LGERKQSLEKVFSLIEATNQRENRFLAKWVLDAGISKKITFHCFRHTFATLQLSMGTDIYTVSKMLGHKDLNTTQIYAKIIDETKRTASNRIKLEM
jgi:site-specific recombinase XerD